MSSRYFHILVLPDRGVGERRWVISSQWLRVGLVFGLATLTLMGILLGSYQKMMGEIDRNGEYRRENFSLRRDLRTIRERAGEIENQVERRQILMHAFNQILIQQDVLNSGNEGRIKDYLASPLPEARFNRLRSLPLVEEHDLKEGGLAASSDSGTAKRPFGSELTSTVQERTNQEIDELKGSLSELQASTLDLEDNVEFSFEFLRDQQAFLMALPTVMPAEGRITSGFGHRRSRLDRRILMHEGVDIANKEGTPILATGNGVVRQVGTKKSYGRTVVVQHGYGVETWYTHAQKLLVRPGQRVNRDQKIALMGRTGSTSTTHVHYEVRVGGIPVDPLHYIFSAEAR